ncbi:MAG: 5-(carboxyamino)imidazole ribonucleotide synthase [Planctomycetes bacterium]|nr:5-(carboxyamino)imidazole ribonucleotide synthase [Planctomycetota bacterium]
MIGLAAHRLGYRVAVLADAPDAPGALVADRVVVGALDDAAAAATLGREADVVTLEVEHVDPAAAAAAAVHAPLRPGLLALRTARDRALEKAFLVAQGAPVGPHAVVETDADLLRALAHTGLPAILKTTTEGYDGRGQRSVCSEAEAVAARAELRGQRLVVEARLDLALEVSVIVARGVDGATIAMGPFENAHRDHILDVSTYPAASLDPVRSREAITWAGRLAAALDLVGLLCVEYFVTRDGRLLVNELAPRPHNSGHLTIEAFAASQFEQLVRAICGLPLALAQPRSAAVMGNLLGDLWTDGDPDWVGALAVPDVHLHLYGKRAARPGRKMGHLTALGADLAEAVARLRTARAALRDRSLSQRAAGSAAGRGAPR